MKANLRFTAVAIAIAVSVAGCDSITTVKEEPAFATPSQKVVLSGTVSGLSATRALQLSVELTDNGIDSGTTVRSFFGTEVLRLGAVDIGAGYNVTVAQNPFGRLCQVSNGSGVANAAVNNIAVTCVTDPAVPLYTATLNIAPAIANALPPNFRVSLSTEEGVETIAPVAGQTAVVFANPILASGSNLPTFTYTMTATTESNGVVGNCAVTGSTNVAGENTAAPVGNVVGTVTACEFTIGGTVGYSQPPHIPYAARTITGLQIGLKDNGSQEVVETIDVAPFTPAVPGTATTPFTFAGRPSTASALYEVTVTAQPTGMYCVVDNGGLASLGVRPSTTSSGITSPATQPTNIPGPGVPTVNVRCRDLPSANGTLVGIYQVVGQDSTFTTVAGPRTTVVNTKNGTADPDGVGTTTTTTVNGGAPTVAATTPSFDRRFLAFFANGTFLYGVHGSTTTSTFFGRDLNTCATCGVEQGFYYYDDVSRNIYFTIRTDTNNGVIPPFTFPPSNSLVAGLSGMPGLYNGVPTMTDVVKTAGERGTLTGVFGPGGSTPTTNVSAWTLREPVQSVAELEGAWATADSKRVFVYTKAGQRTAFHMGVNGAPNMQDACLGILEATAPSGFWTPRDRSTGCTPGAYLNPADTTPPIGLTGGYTPIDIPEAAGLTGSNLMGSNYAIWPGYLGRMPGTQSNDSVTRSPSPVEFDVTQGVTDTLTVQNTDNGVPVGAPIAMQRVRPN